MTKKFLFASVAALTLGISAPAFAQFTLDGSAVPADQVGRIQQHCDMLLSNETSGASAGTVDAGTTTEAEAGADTGADATTSGDSSAATSGDAATSTDAMASASSEVSVDFATLDLNTIDIEACRTGGFLGAEGTDAGTSTDASSGSETTTSN